MEAAHDRCLRNDAAPPTSALRCARPPWLPDALARCSIAMMPVSLRSRFALNSQERGSLDSYNLLWQRSGMLTWTSACRPIWAMVLATVLTVGIHIRPAQADTPAALSAIADTADRICGILATRGEANTTKVTGEVHAELSGLAKRLASVGVSGSSDIASSNYQGMLQQDLPATLKDIRDCKLKVFDKLQATVLPGTTQPSGPGAPSADLLQAPGGAPLIDTAKFDNQKDELGFYSCSNEQDKITCYIVQSRTAQGQSDYKIDSQMKTKFKLVDNFHIEHRLQRMFYMDGLGSHQQNTNLSFGESIWLVLEFEPAPRRISSARIVFNANLFNPYRLEVYQIRGPVN